ncbi:MAG: hypothetical protein SGJ11_15425 [Phycisphaerae bacterium]|nr:hypothetical protein [Phycisphaerae bacterium]
MLPDKFHCGARDLTNDAEVLGYCTDEFGSFSENFVWRDGTMVELTQFIDAPSDISFGAAPAINNAGQITIFAATSGTDIFYAFRLTPVHGTERRPRRRWRCGRRRSRAAPRRVDGRLNEFAVHMRAIFNGNGRVGAMSGDRMGRPQIAHPE